MPFLEVQRAIEVTGLDSVKFDQRAAVALLAEPSRHLAGLKVGVIGNSLPRLCGIATFTTDLQQALAQSPRVRRASIIAMTDREQQYDYPANVDLSIADEDPAAYNVAARFLNAGRVDVVSLQHEFGIFGGPVGSDMSVVRTFGATRGVD